MKKIILILALISSNLCNAQSDYVKIINATDTVSVNDSITIVFTRTINSSGNGMSRIQLWTTSYLQDCLNVYSSFLSLDSANTYKIKVKILPIMGFGIARLYSNATINNYKPFYIRNPNPISVNEFIKNAHIIKVEYYDIYGKEKLSNEGLVIRITTYSNGYQKKDKIITQ